MVVINVDSGCWLKNEQTLFRKCMRSGYGIPYILAVSWFKETFPGNYTHRIVWDEDSTCIVSLELTFSSEIEETAWVLKWL